LVDKGHGARLLCTPRDDEEEARTVVEEIEYARIAKRIPWSEQAIFVSDQYQARPLEPRLRKGSISLSLDWKPKLFDRREVKDFLRLSQDSVNPDDDISLCGSQISARV